MLGVSWTDGEAKAVFMAEKWYRSNATPWPDCCGECPYRSGGRPHDTESCGHPDHFAHPWARSKEAPRDVDFNEPPPEACPLRNQ